MKNKSILKRLLSLSLAGLLVANTGFVNVFAEPGVSDNDVSGNTVSSNHAADDRWSLQISGLC